MKKYNFLTLISGCLVTGFATAQLDQSRSSIVSTGNNIHLPVDYLRNELLGNNNLPDNVVGSQYFIQEFLPGKVVVNDSISYNAMLRYNAYSDEIEMQKDGKISGLFKRPYLSAIINNDNFTIQNFQTDAGQKVGYFQTLVTGPVSLYAKKTKLYSPGKKATSTYTKDVPPTFTDEIDYFILNTNELVLQKIKLKTKSIIELLGEDVKLKKFAKENEIEIKKENDLIKLINYYNGLVN